LKVLPNLDVVTVGRPVPGELLMLRATAAEPVIMFGP
jgi:hypothetical protein